MQQNRIASVYRICGVDDEHWEVSQGPSGEPIATFADRHSALAYAMSLAKEGSDSLLPPGRRDWAWRNILSTTPFRSGDS